MKVAVEFFANAIASKSFLVDVPDGLTGEELKKAIGASDRTLWKHVREWDTDAEFDDDDPAAIYSLDSHGDLGDVLWR